MVATATASCSTPDRVSRQRLSRTVLRRIARLTRASLAGAQKRDVAGAVNGAATIALPARSLSAASGV